MSEENESEISILKNSINLALGDESVIAEFERQFLEHDTSIFENWERSRLEQFAALQYLRAYFRKATLVLLLKHAKQYNELSRSELKTLNSLIKKSLSNEAINSELTDNFEEMITFLRDELKAKVTALNQIKAVRVKGGIKKAENSPQAKAKKEIKILFEIWEPTKKINGKLYATDTAFAKYATADTVIKNDDTIKRWIREWRKSARLC
jgi:hypothetical protein